ncbi:MAG: PEP-CTERM sorting domain-containing protein [Armatimonadota bacterium]|nr:PEP-CTERM sorting domain-containing protein [bacterium]
MKHVSILRHAIIVGCVTVLAASTAMAAITGTFVKADSTNTTSEAVNAFDWTSMSPNGYDGKWGLENWGSYTALTSHPRFQDDNGWTGEDCPSITTVVRGLDTTRVYDVYVQLLTHPQGNWAIFANLNWMPNTLLTKNNTTSTGLMWGDGPISEYKLGSVTGQDWFVVNVDDYSTSTDFALSQYYGVSFVDVTPNAVPEPSSILALATGLCGIVGLGGRLRRK